MTTAKSSRTQVLACAGCPARVAIEPSCNLAEECRRSGFAHLFRNDTSSAWLCPACLAKIVPHVQAIVDLLGEESDLVYWSCLRYLLKETK